MQKIDQHQQRNTGRVLEYLINMYYHRTVYTQNAEKLPPLKIKTKNIESFKISTDNPFNTWTNMYYRIVYTQNSEKLPPLKIKAKNIESF